MTKPSTTPRPFVVADSTSTAPLWLLDFDDVVNACLPKAAKRPDPTVWKDWVRTDIYSRSTGFAWPVWYSPTVVRFIAAAHTAGVDIQWLSTWQGDTEAFPAEIPGMPALPWLPEPTPLPCDPDEPFEPWWKYRVARAVAADRPLVWTDDDLAAWGPEYREARTWAERRAHTHVEIPTPRIGLTPRRLRGIREFLTEHGINLPA